MPVINRVAADYEDRIRFIGVAGNNTELSRARQRATELIDRLDWGLDDSLWELYNVPYQPYSVLITGDDVVLVEWFGPKDEADMRAELDRLVATTGA
ncbi:MAG: hypothetical protein BMS9Abin07_0097 [Acidimicrobiia bacterium]|nr:MAG: hypothetical protein BMS9Abin07_0097 [Acidimicrobiia bacterium]